MIRIIDDYRIFGSLLGSPYLGKLPHAKVFGHEVPLYTSIILLYIGDMKLYTQNEGTMVLEFPRYAIVLMVRGNRSHCPLAAEPCRNLVELRAVILTRLHA